MARGGSRGRRSNYVRDNSGRFASSPGGGPPKRSTPASRRAARPTVTGGTLGARGSLRRSRTKLAAKNPADRSLQGSLSLRAQKGAVTRGANRLGKARAASTVRMAARAGVIRGGRKVAAKPVAAPKSSVRVIRPNRPAMRPGPGPDRGKISEYVGAVRGARRRLSSAKPGSANAAEAKQGLKDNRQALSRRIQRERGARRGLKPATSQQVLTGTVPAPPARRVNAARPAGTVAKPKGLKPGAIAGRGKAGKGARSWSKPNVSFAAMARRLQKVSTDMQAIVARRQSAERMIDLRAERSGQYPKSAAKRRDYFARATQAEMNRRQNAVITAQRAKQFYDAAIFAASNFGSRPKYTTQQDSKSRPLPALTSYFSAWRGYSYTPRKSGRRNP